ncbi:MAG: carboxypeptidase regulatory-like domain-containing protein [Bacteroidales bacterium]|nr:carboxypeptidase regulatory-like domain-containing protein [Bacteroidales bacterium]
MKKITILFFFLSLFTLITAQENLVIRLDNPSREALKFFLTNEYDIASYHPGEYLDIVVDSTEFQRLLRIGYEFRVFQTQSDILSNLSVLTDIPGYRTYPVALAELQQIANTYPAICKLYDLGDSRGKQYYDGGNNNYVNYQHDIWALKVSSNVELDEDKPAVFYMGAHHAREPLSTEVTFYILNHLLQQYGTDPDITNSINTKEIWFVPIVNPDGHKIVLDQIDQNWRKNIRDNNSNGQLTPGSFSTYPDGVDPNRNYGWEWGGQGSSATPSSMLYRGPSAFSEPEVQAMRDLMLDRHFVAGITYHTYSQLVLWPYGYVSNAVAPDATALAALGTQMAQTIPKLNGGTYTPQPSWALYPAAGVTDDYAYGEHGIFCYTIELATQFIPPQSQVIQICEDNLEAALILLERVDQSTLTGLVTDATTDEPLMAEVYVEGMDNTGLYREPYKSNEDFGRYFRLLPDGNYTVTFSLFGYLPQTFQNVTINSSGQTVLNVELAESQFVNVSGHVYDIADGQPIANASVELMGAPVDPVYTDANGYYLIEDVYEGTYTIHVSESNYYSQQETVQITSGNNVFNFQLTAAEAESFEIGVFGPGWTFSGNANWFIADDDAWHGQYAARSGNISHSQSSSMMYSLDVESNGFISFYYKVSSEEDYDFLRFYINDVQKGSWSGAAGWAEASYALQPGLNNFRWTYSKDGSVSTGQDRAWIDFIEFPPSDVCSPPLNLLASAITPTSALLSWTQGSDETVWDLKIGIKDFDPLTEGQLIADLTETFLQVSELANSTGYDFYVRSHCEGEERSIWRGPETFETMCMYFVPSFSENFDAAPSLPGCWEIVDHEGNGQVWEFGLHTEGLTGTTGYYAFLNSDGFGIGNAQNTDLVSPAFDFSGFEEVSLSFVHYFREYAGTSASLYYTIDAGLNWVLLEEWIATTPNPTVFQAAIPEVAGQENVRFKWNFTGSYGWYWDIDDIETTGVPVGPDVPIERFIEHETVGNESDVCYDATETILVSDFLVQNGGTVNLVAGQQIFLLEETLVEAGGYLLARITETEDYCTQRASILLSEPIAISKPELLTDNSSLFKIFPNPASGIVTIELSEKLYEAESIIQVFSMTGELMLQRNSTNQNTIKLDFTLSQRDVYLICVTSGSSTASEKLIVD